MRRDTDEWQDQLQSLAEGQYAAFLSDLQADPTQSELLKSVRDTRAADDAAQSWSAWETEMETIGMLKGQPRLRTPDRVDPDAILGPEDFGGPERLLNKRHEPMKGRPNSVIKSDNGWTHVYGPTGELVRAFGPNVDEESFERY